MKKKIITTCGIVLIIIAGVAIFLSQTAKNTQTVNADYNITSTPVPSPEPTPSPQPVPSAEPTLTAAADQEEDQLQVKSAEEILNDQKVSSAPTVTPKASAKSEKAEGDSAKDGDKNTKNSQKDEVKVIDESPDTIKDETVNEYQGGEKTGTGSSFMDQMPKNMPTTGPMEDSSTGTGGGPVGTWD